MAWAPDTALVEGLDVFGGAVVALAPTDWAKASPCARWRALDVLGHVGTAVRFGTALLEGEQPEWAPVDPPGTAVEGVPAEWWASIADRARRAVATADLTAVVDSPMGRRTVGEGLSFPALDLFVHAWDLARAGGREVELPAEAIEFAHRVVDPVPESQVRSARVFGPAVAVAPDAGPTAAFVAWTGRRPDWMPEGH